MRGVDLKRVDEFRNLGSAFPSNGECGKELEERVQGRWSGWRRVAGAGAGRVEWVE